MVRPYSFIQLTPEQTKELEIFLSGGYSRYGLRARRRAQVVWFSHEGMTVTQIAQRLKVSKCSIWKWLKTYKEKGLADIKGKYFYRMV
jgi:hypothetical protein